MEAEHAAPGSAEFPAHREALPGCAAYEKYILYGALSVTFFPSEGNANAAQKRKNYCKAVAEYVEAKSGGNLSSFCEIGRASCRQREVVADGGLTAGTEQQGERADD